MALLTQALFLSPALAQPGGDRPEPPQFQAPIYIDRPQWMDYETPQSEPLANVSKRVASYGEQSYDIDTLLYNGTGAIDIVVMGDGYTDLEQDKLTRDAKACTDHLFETSPFDRYKSFFNVFVLHIVSPESGISHPGQWKQETDSTGRMVCPENSPLPIVNKKTFFSTHLDGWGTHRIIGAWGEHKAKDLIRLYFPRCKFPCILCNTDEYGGAGGDILIATCNRASSDIYVHELAHVFGDLADEYFGGDVYMCEKPNLSATRDSSRVRWARWLDDPEVGVFPHRGGRIGSRYVKPTQASETSRYCKMERLDKEFCPVCRERLVEAIHEQVSLIADALPADTVLSPLKKREKMTFALERVFEAEGDTLSITWSIDGQEVARDTRAITVSGRQLSPNQTHEIRVEVHDASPFVRNPRCRELHTQSRTWMVARRR